VWLFVHAVAADAEERAEARDVWPHWLQTLSTLLYSCTLFPQRPYRAVARALAGVGDGEHVPLLRVTCSAEAGCDAAPATSAAARSERSARTTTLVAAVQSMRAAACSGSAAAAPTHAVHSVGDCT